MDPKSKRWTLQSYGWNALGTDADYWKADLEQGQVRIQTPTGDTVLPLPDPTIPWIQQPEFAMKQLDIKSGRTCPFYLIDHRGEMSFIKGFAKKEEPESASNQNQDPLKINLWADDPAYQALCSADVWIDPQTADLYKAQLNINWFARSLLSRWILADTLERVKSS